MRVFFSALFMLHLFKIHKITYRFESETLFMSTLILINLKMLFLSWFPHLNPKTIGKYLNVYFFLLFQFTNSKMVHYITIDTFVILYLLFQYRHSHNMVSVIHLFGFVSVQTCGQVKNSVTLFPIKEMYTNSD